MSRSSERERALLNRVERTQSTDIRSGLTVGGHPVHEIVADSDESFRIKSGILGGEAAPRSIASGLTFGDPAARDAHEAQRVARADTFVQQERLDREELAMRRETEALEYAAEAVYLASRDGWRDPALNAQAVQFWAALDTRQRGMLVVDGSVDETDADHLHNVVWPHVERAASEHNVAATQAASTTQKALALMRIREERGNPNDPEWHEHQKAVFAKAREKGLKLSDDNLGSIQFEDEFRAAEIVLAEDIRADANARFQLAVLNTESTNVSEGLKVLGPNGYVSTLEGGEIPVKPDYARAGARVLGGGEGPEFDREDDIKAGILGATALSEGREWRATQEDAGRLFSEAEEARIAQKLGER